MIVFIVHLAALIVLLVAYGPVQTAFTQAFNSTLQTLNTQPQTSSDYISTCSTMYNMSSLFTCCGSNSSSDLNIQAQTNCCVKPTPTQGCSTLIFNEIKQYSIYFLIIPTAVLLGVELICIIVVPFLIASISRNKY